ncbi:hypothetical protein L1987_57306 [Smallanthus sonchifolius]|uniref:Uncharacterized protein n=1 Tax=Smallanthus sonchifolius TaxID=185202 RepID=A0ACB9DC87_9ASTR|nr:hypothetical protein L1987_57306 [Smallanthus sonchifolius]
MRKVIEREVVATLEVTNNTKAKKAIVVGKRYRKSVEIEGKFGDSYKVRESYEADITKMGEKINVQKHKIKIDCEAIHQLLGVPCGDVTIESITKLKIKDESVKTWRNRYPRNFVAPSGLVSNIENAEDEDSFNFRLDFLLCFLAVMVECHGQGRRKEKILHKMTGDTDFSKINWSAYIMNSMRDPQSENENCANDVQDEQEEPEDPQVNA